MGTKVYQTCGTALLMTLRVEGKRLIQADRIFLNCQTAEENELHPSLLCLLNMTHVPSCEMSPTNPLLLPCLFSQMHPDTVQDVCAT